MSSRHEIGLRSMTTPRVKEIVRAPEPVDHDDFVDDLAPKR